MGTYSTHLKGTSRTREGANQPELDPERPYELVMKELAEVTAEFVRLRELRRELSIEADRHVLNCTPEAIRPGRRGIARVAQATHSTFYSWIGNAGHTKIWAE
jgi:hypothetical protein